ncbi:MAG TPA: hypothetical protein VFH97_06935 [Gemmatimonadales bacterium]|nr:hypothetical protein [Gemmatimonadales bacterium]
MRRAGWLGLTLGLATVSPAAAQVAPQMESRGDGWRLAWRPTLEGEYSDNVFLLSPGRRSELAAPSAAMVQSGRFADMESASDVVTAGELGLGLRGRGLSGRTLELIPEVGYALYARNSRRSHARFGMTVEQALPRDGRFRVRGELRPDYFFRNYLADATDANASGSISEDERVYQAGISTGADVSADYRFRLKKSRSRSPLGLAAEVSAGFASRSFDAPFALRSRKGLTGGAALLMDLGERVALDLDYGFARQAATAGDLLLILDEPDLGEDLNGNATLTDQNVPLRRTVDASRNQHLARATLAVEVTDAVDLTVSYARRWNDYRSALASDPVYRGRLDTRNAFEGEVDVRLARRLHLEIGGGLIDQNTNRPSDLGAVGEEDDYRVLRAHLGFSYRR